MYMHSLIHSRAPSSKTVKAKSRQPLKKHGKVAKRKLKTHRRSDVGKIKVEGGVESQSEPKGDLEKEKPSSKSSQDSSNKVCTVKML